jgi:hypothetical protein
MASAKTNMERNMAKDFCPIFPRRQEGTFVNRQDTEG